jgi:hypothetical protein
MCSRGHTTASGLDKGQSKFHFVQPLCLLPWQLGWICAPLAGGPAGVLQKVLWAPLTKTHRVANGLLSMSSCSRGESFCLSTLDCRSEKEGLLAESWGNLVRKEAKIITWANSWGDQFLKNETVVLL